MHAELRGNRLAGFVQDRSENMPDTFTMSRSSAWTETGLVTRAPERYNQGVLLPVFPLTEVDDDRKYDQSGFGRTIPYPGGPGPGP
ncbi:MAG TPA: hypothetical protein DEB39_12935 [Planctomycetaceae bacterium]|nr:hypothetical protein [Planctomycetaceae bacterium]